MLLRMAPIRVEEMTIARDDGTALKEQAHMTRRLGILVSSVALLGGCTFDGRIYRTPEIGGAETRYRYQPNAKLSWTCEGDEHLSLVEEGGKEQLFVASQDRLVKNSWVDEQGTHFFVWEHAVVGIEYVVGPRVVHVRIHRLEAALTKGTDQIVRPNQTTVVHTDLCVPSGVALASIYRGAAVAPSPPGPTTMSVGHCAYAGNHEGMRISVGTGTVIKSEFDEMAGATGDTPYQALTPLPPAIRVRDGKLFLSRKDGTGILVSAQTELGGRRGWYYERADTGFFVTVDEPKLVYVYAPLPVNDDNALRTPAPEAYFAVCQIH